MNRDLKMVLQFKHTFKDGAAVEQRFQDGAAVEQRFQDGAAV